MEKFNKAEEWATQAVNMLNEHAALVARINNQAAEIQIQNDMIVGARKAASNLMIENSTLEAVAEAVRNLPEAIYTALENIGCDGNAVELREAMAKLTMRGGKAVQA